MSRVAETFKSAIDQVTYGSDFQLGHMHVAKVPNITNKKLNTTINNLEN